VSVAALGSDHPDVAIILRNIGILKASQRQYAEAELLLNQSLSLTHRVLGHEHPIAAGTMRTCAVFYASRAIMGKLSGSFVVRSTSVREPSDRNILRWRRAGRCSSMSSTLWIEIPRLPGQGYRRRTLEPDLLLAAEWMGERDVRYSPVVSRRRMKFASSG